MTEFAVSTNVAALDGANGFRLDGDNTYDSTGRAVAGAGDVNGDGFADLLIGAPVAGSGGLAWLVFGAASTPAAAGLAARVSANTAYRFEAEASGDQAGYDIAGVGDVNNDGKDDFVISARLSDPDSPAGNRGTSYLLFGGAANLEVLDTADGLNDNIVGLINVSSVTGFRFEGAADNDASGHSVSGAGDVNGDGIDDLLIGAPYADPITGLGNGDEGSSYIIFGGSNLGDLDDDDGAADGSIDLSQISAGQGFRLDGVAAFATDRSGYSVSLAGDVNGDGFEDAIVGAPYADPNGPNDNEGSAYLVFGRDQALFTAASLHAAVLDGVEGTRFDGAVGGDATGNSVSRLGDVNADGFDDIAIGANLGSFSATESGSVYVVFGKSAWSASTSLSSLDGVTGFRLDGIRADDNTGVNVAGAGDVNGDGFSDVLVTSMGFDRLGAADAGAAYVVFGKSQGFAAVIDLGALDGDSGFRIEGAAYGDALGRGAAGAGDVNGDGFDDVVLGANAASNNSLSSSGSSYVIYGHRAETSVARVGTALDNTINGGKGGDTIKGLSGDDQLTGWEGDDDIDGGSGADNILAGEGSDMIRGGGGDDVMDGGTGDDSLSGGSGNDNLAGLGGDDAIIGADGLDTLDGGAGNDTISGGSERDTIIASAGEDVIDGGSERDTWDFSGFDVNSAISLDLTTGSFAHPNGEDVQTFFSIENVTGTSRADIITGNGVRNTLKGGSGDDTVSGGGAADTIQGNFGQDLLTGGTGGDVFAYSLTTDSGSSSTARDKISDFTTDPAVSAAFVDRIDVSAIDAMAATGGNNDFIFIGGAAFSAEGQVRAVQSGADTWVEFNNKGTGTADMRIVLLNFTVANLGTEDFVL